MLVVVTLRRSTSRALSMILDTLGWIEGNIKAIVALGNMMTWFVAQLTNNTPLIFSTSFVSTIVESRRSARIGRHKQFLIGSCKVRSGIGKICVRSRVSLIYSHFLTLNKTNENVKDELIATENLPCRVKTSCYGLHFEDIVMYKHRSLFKRLKLKSQLKDACPRLSNEEVLQERAKFMRKMALLSMT
uniref:Uncharacterized protein n=1 Tax=Cannabis sativa TaxID=3483 RepID=A0A803NSL0_CANSA